MIDVKSTPLVDLSVFEVLKLIKINTIIHYYASGKLFDYYLRKFM